MSGAWQEKQGRWIAGGARMEAMERRGRLGGMEGRQTGGQAGREMVSEKGEEGRQGFSTGNRATGLGFRV